MKLMNRDFEYETFTLGNLSTQAAFRIHSVSEAVNGFLSILDSYETIKGILHFCDLQDK